MSVAKSKKPAKETTPGEAPLFHWSYIILPLALLFLSILLTAYFYHLLPASAAYHFKPDGTPDKWLSREMIAAGAIAPQFLLTLVAAVTTWGISRFRILFTQGEGAWVKPERILAFMGNIIVLPQLIVFFALLDIFSYNSYQIHIMPLWISLLIILGLATIVLGALLTFIILNAKRELISQPGRRIKED